jgi:hypothetical protein
MTAVDDVLHRRGLHHPIVDIHIVHLEKFCEAVLFQDLRHRNEVHERQSHGLRA